MNRNCKHLVCVLTVGMMTVSCATSQTVQQDYFSNWPEGASPAVIGKRLAENFIARKFEFETNVNRRVIYPEACVWYGSLTVAELTKDQDLQNRVIRKFELVQTPTTSKISTNAHVDYRVFGIGLLHGNLVAFHGQMVGKNGEQVSHRIQPFLGDHGSLEICLLDHFRLHVQPLVFELLQGVVKLLEGGLLAHHLARLQETHGLVAKSHGHGGFAQAVSAGDSGGFLCGVLG